MKNSVLQHANKARYLEKSKEIGGDGCALGMADFFVAWYLVYIKRNVSVSGGAGEPHCSSSTWWAE
jgi:hypothetical protein